MTELQHDILSRMQHLAPMRLTGYSRYHAHAIAYNLLTMSTVRRYNVSQGFADDVLQIETAAQGLAYAFVGITWPGVRSPNCPNQPLFHSAALSCDHA